MKARTQTLCIAWLTLTALLMACQSVKESGGRMTSTADLKAIERLHGQDMAAAKVWDVETLVSLWTDDIVTLPPDGPPVIGKEANRSALMKMREASRDLKIEDYVLTFSEVKIAGEWAFEWGAFAGTMRPASGGAVERQSLARAQTPIRWFMESRPHDV